MFSPPNIQEFRIQLTAYVGSISAQKSPSLILTKHARNLAECSFQ